MRCLCVFVSTPASSEKDLSSARRPAQYQDGKPVGVDQGDQSNFDGFIPCLIKGQIRNALDRCHIATSCTFPELAFIAEYYANDLSTVIVRHRKLYETHRS